MRRPIGVSLSAAICLLLAAALAVAKPRPVPLSELFPLPDQSKSAVVIGKVLERYHYRKIEIDTAFVSKVLARYIDDLDPNRAFFLARDVERFNRGVRQLDEHLRRGRFDIAFDIFRVYRERVDERVRHALELLKHDFRFTTPEYYVVSGKDAAWAETFQSLDERWRKRVKNDVLTLKLTGKSASEIRERLNKRYAGLGKRIAQLDSDDVFQTFMNAFTQSIEPHTSYMSPSSSENFDISMKLSLEGIGAVLRADNEYTVVQSTVPGGPARESGQIHTGDQIIGVAQGLDSEMEDVVGWRLDDVVEKIRGPKGSVVRLQIMPKSTGSTLPTREIALVRKEIKLEDQAAKRSIIERDGDGRVLKIGVIEVPAFYRDFDAEGAGRRDFRSTTRDVKKLIDQLVMAGIDGLVIDLRDNGGGSLVEATSLTGLFIDTGPVVQVKDTFGQVEVESDRDRGTAYNGPLAVLVNRNSASASEIFAAAIQDYGRGLVVGEPTFGKGTVQTLIDLNRYLPGDQTDFGRLRLTMAEFFRISGGSTQLRGVEPDIRFPSADYMDEHGERSLDNALPWTRIDPARHDAVKIPTIVALANRSTARVSQDLGFRLLTERSRLLQEVEQQKQLSLQEKARRTQDERRDHQFKEDLERFLATRGLEPIDEDAERVDEQALERQQNAIKQIEVDEAANILADEIRMTAAGAAPPAAFAEAVLEAAE